MNNVILQAKSIKLAMRSASILASEERHKLEVILANLGELVKEIKLAQDPSNCMQNIFMRITPKTVPAQHMFGSNVRSQVINELAIAYAKLEDGVWVPDEDRIFAKFALSERTLSEAMWNRDTFSGTPINFIEDHGTPLAKYELRTAPEDNYNVSFNKQADKQANLIKAIKDIIAQMESGDKPLVKLSASNLVDALRNAAKYIGADNSYDLEILTEKLDRNSSDMRSEILSAAYSSLAQITEHAQLEYRKESAIDFDTPYGAYFAVNLDAGVREIIRDLISEDMDAHPEDYPKGEKENWAKDDEGSRVKSKTKHFASNQACLAISNTQGQHSGLFGDERSHQSVISFDFNFCGHEQISDDTDYYDRVLALFRITMTKIQLMSLLQGSMIDMWEKATLTRLTYFGVAEDSERIADEKAKRTYKLDELAVTQEIKSDIEAIAAMSANIRSKTGKAEFIGAIETLIVKIEAASKDKRVQIDEKVSEVIAVYKDDAVTFASALSQKAGHLLSDRAKDSITRLLADKSEN